MTSEGENPREVVAIEGREALCRAMQQVIGEARRSLLMLSMHLDGALYKQHALVECLKQQLLDNRRLRVKLIISEPSVAAKQAEPFIELTRRLPSQFELREPVARIHQFEDECLIADRRAYVYRGLRNSRTAKLALHDAIGAHALRKRFDDYWQHTHPCTEFRQLGA